MEQIHAPALLAARRDVQLDDRLARMVDDDEIEIGRALGELAPADAVAFGLGLDGKRERGDEEEDLHPRSLSRRADPA